MKRVKKFAEEFKKFISRGNVLDLAVAVVIGAAFGKIVTSLVDDMITPLLSLVIGKIDFENLKWVIIAATDGAAEVAVRYGNFIKNIINFLIIAFCIFLAVYFYTKAKSAAENAKKKFFDDIKKNGEENGEDKNTGAFIAEPETVDAAGTEDTAAPKEETPEELLKEIRDLLKAVSEKE